MRHFNHKKPVNTPAQSCLRRYGGAEHAQVRLVCFPWAGAGASVYRRFAYHLPDQIELFSIQYPGREDRYNEPRLTRMEDIVRHVITDIRSLMDKPVVFFGHSMGALVAYEVAQSLNTCFAWEPELLIVSGSGSPGDEGTYERCPGNASEEDLINEMQRLGGTPKQVLEDAQMMKTLLPVMRADYEVLDHYVSDTPASLSSPIVACAGQLDSSVSEKTVDSWRRYTSGTCQQFWFKGDHFYLTSNYISLLRHMEDWILNRAEIFQPMPKTAESA